MPDNLKCVHQETLAAIAALESLLAADSPDRAALADARWKLTRISTRRVQTVEALHARLTEIATAAERLKLAELRADYVRLRAASTAHIGRWTLDEIMADWDGYRAASAKMRAAMRARIAAEIDTLYPLIDRLTAACDVRKRA